MSTVLTNGIIIPENGSRNWGGDLANNWNIIDLNVGYMTDVKNKVTTLENSVAENTADIQTNASNISALQTSKQDTINDLETIRTGASSGATAVQPSALNNYYTKSEVDTNLSSKANDDAVVHKSGDESISGIKSFSDGVVGNVTGSGALALQSKNNTSRIYLRDNVASSYPSSINLYSKLGDNPEYGVFLQGNIFFPNMNNILILGKLDYRWASVNTYAINGINPGALSLPNPSPSVFISKSLPSSGGTITADVDGWFEIRTKATSPNALIQLFVAGGNSTYAKNAGDTLIISVAMRAGISVTIFYKDIDTPTVCRLIPCIGNV